MTTIAGGDGDDGGDEDEGSDDDKDCRQGVSTGGSRPTRIARSIDDDDDDGQQLRF